MLSARVSVRPSVRPGGAGTAVSATWRASSCTRTRPRPSRPPDRAAAGRTRRRRQRRAGVRSTTSGAPLVIAHCSFLARREAVPSGLSADFLTDPCPRFAGTFGDIRGGTTWADWHHGNARVPARLFEFDRGRPVIYVVTWNHLMSFRPQLGPGGRPMETRAYGAPTHPPDTTHPSAFYSRRCRQGSPTPGRSNHRRRLHPGPRRLAEARRGALQRPPPLEGAESSAAGPCSLLFSTLCAPPGDAAP